MSLLRPRQIGLRAQDIQTGLESVDLSAAGGVLDTTRLVGMAERLAIHVRGAEVIEDYERLKAMAGQLGIDGLILPQVLDVLQEAEFVQIHKAGGAFAKLYDRVPYFHDLYEVMGSVWGSRRPTEIERKSVELLEDLSVRPLTEDAVRGKFDLSDQELALIRDIGVEGAYFRLYESPSDGQKILTSPLFWDENAEAVYQLLKKYKADEVAAAIAKVKSNQGYPLPDLTMPVQNTVDQIILECMVRGILPSPSVSSLKGEKRFAFTPYVGNVQIAKEEKPILDKARAILSCVRYGEHFGTITRISDPDRLLKALEDSTRGRRIGPHTEIKQQYALLVLKGIGRITRDTRFADRYYFELIDTGENLKALQLARDMLSVGEMLTGRGYDPGVREILFHPGTYTEVLASLARLKAKRTPLWSKESASLILDRIVDRVREDWHG